MRKTLYITLTLFAAACTNKPKDSKTELADLKKQQADINSRIAKLETKTGGQDSAKVTEVSTLEVKTSAFVNYVELQGKIDAQDNVTAYPQSPGTIIAINVKAGQHVSRGQVLVRLDDNVLQQNIAQSQAQLSLAKTVYQRQKNLWDQKIGTEIQYLQAQTNLQSAERALGALRQQANMFSIKSPINGTVDQMDLKLGQVAQPGQTGIRIINADILKVKADVPESYSSKVKQGANVKVVVPDANDSLMARLTFVAKAIDPTSRSFATEIRLPQRADLRPNMTVILKIANYANNNALVIPLKAIQKSEGGDFVFINQNGTARRVAIKAGASYGGQSEVLTGLKANDQLIVEGASDVEDGDKVKVITSSL